MWRRCEPVLRLEDLEEDVFLSRYNRFVGETEGHGEVHIRDTGRLGELLRPGARVLVRKKQGGRLKYELVAAYREPYGWVLVNSRYHSRLAEHLLSHPLLSWAKEWKREVRWGRSRLDLALYDGKRWVPGEVKGCTLFEGDRALFPDAPTERGRKHVEEVGRVGGVLVFLVLTGQVSIFSPNFREDPQFTASLLAHLPRILLLNPLFSLSRDGTLCYLRRTVPLVFPDLPELRLLAYWLSWKYNLGAVYSLDTTYVVLYKESCRLFRLPEEPRLRPLHRQRVGGVCIHTLRMG